MLGFILIPLWAFADGFAGGNFGWQALKKKGFPGNGTAPAGLLLAGAGYLIFRDPMLPLLAALWVLYRTFPGGWKAFGGSANPTRKQIPGTLARHAIPLAAVGAGHLTVQYFSLVQVAAMGAYALIATGLAVLYAKIIAEHAAKGEGDNNENAVIEALRGGFFGAAVVLPLVFG